MLRGSKPYDPIMDSGRCAGRTAPGSHMPERGGWQRRGGDEKTGHSKGCRGEQRKKIVLKRILA